MPTGWQLEDFGPCIAEWLGTQPPVEWRRPVNEWVRALPADPTFGAEREPALDSDGWSGWFCEVPGAGNALVVVVAFYRVSHTSAHVRCVRLETVPRFRG